MVDSVFLSTMQYCTSDGLAWLVEHMVQLDLSGACCTGLCCIFRTHVGGNTVQSQRQKSNTDRLLWPKR